MNNGLKALFSSAAVATVALVLPYNYQSVKVANEAPEAGFRPDALLVPTGDNGRIIAALRVLDQSSPQCVLFISGVHADVTAESLQAALREIDPAITLDPARLFISTAARNTPENAKEFQAFLNSNPVIQNVMIISSDYHLERLRLEMQRVDLSPNINVRYSASDTASLNGVLMLEVTKTALSTYEIWDWPTQLNFKIEPLPEP